MKVFIWATRGKRKSNCSDCHEILKQKSHFHASGEEKKSGYLLLLRANEDGDRNVEKGGNFILEGKLHW